MQINGAGKNAYCVSDDGNVDDDGGVTTTTMIKGGGRW